MHKRPVRRFLQGQVQVVTKYPFAAPSLQTANAVLVFYMEGDTGRASIKKGAVMVFMTAPFLLANMRLFVLSFAFLQPIFIGVADFLNRIYGVAAFSTIFYVQPCSINGFL